MAGRSSRVQARAWKYNEAHRRQKETLKNLEINANLYKVLEGAGAPPNISRPGRGSAPRGGQSGWGYEGYVISRSRSGERWGARQFYQYQKGVSDVTIGRRTYGPGRVDARIYYEGEEDWKRKINAAYWAGQGMQDDIAKQRARLEGWKAFDPSTVGSSRGMGGSRLGTSSSVVSVGGGFASASAVVGPGGQGSGIGTDSKGRPVAVDMSKTEVAKATATGVAKYGSGFATGFASPPKTTTKKVWVENTIDEKAETGESGRWEVQTVTGSYAKDSKGNIMSWGALKEKGKRTPKTKVGKMAQEYKAEFISDFEAAGLDVPDGSVDPETMHKYFDTEIAGLQAQLDSGYVTEGGKQKDGSWSPLTYKAIASADAQSLKDQISAKQLARASFMTGAQQKARAEEINASTIEQQKVKEELEQYMGRGSNYLNPEQYSQKLKSYQDEETHVRGLVGSSYRELLYGEDIRLDTSALVRDEKTGKLSKSGVRKDNVSQQEQLYRIDDRRDASGNPIVYDRKQLEGMRKSRQRGQTQYVIPDMPETRDPRLQRSRFRKIVRYTRQELPRYREEYKTRELELQQLRIQEKASTKQYQAYLQQIQTKTQDSVDVYRKTGGSTIKFDDAFGSELRQFGTKRKQLQLDIAIAETEVDALKKNIEATDAELERLKKLKTKMGGENVGGGGRMVNPARIKIAQAKRGYGSAIMSQGERSARRRSGLSGGGRKARRQARFEASGLVVGETEGRRPDKNKFAFDVLRSLERERRRILGQ